MLNMTYIYIQLKYSKNINQKKKEKKPTLHSAHKSSDKLDNCDNGRVAFMQETLLKPVLLPAIRSFTASNSRSAKYLL